MANNRFNPPPKSQSKIGPVKGITDRNVAKPQPIAEQTGAGDIRTSITTYFTKAPQPGGETPVLYNGDRNWARVTVMLETAGPVVVGNASSLLPVLSGKGQLLTTNIPVTFTIAKGTRLYIQSTGVNRVRLEVAPVPWLEQIAAGVGAVVDRLKALATGKPADTSGKE